MAKFLMFITPFEEDPILLNVDQIVAIKITDCHIDEEQMNADITFIVRDFEVCSKAGFVEFGQPPKAEKQPPKMWYNEFIVTIVGDKEAAKNALIEALNQQEVVADLGQIALKYEDAWVDANLPSEDV